MSRRTIPGPDVLLCENCGYVLEGLDERGSCPECGKAVSESLSMKRVGSPWQRRPGLGSWISTIRMVVGRPVAIWNVVSVEPLRAAYLTMINIVLACAGPAIAMLVFSLMPPLHNRDWFGAALVSFLATWAIGAPVVSGLSLIEYAGIRGLAHVHRWRVGHVAAIAICAHASVAWLGLLALAIVPLFAIEPDWMISIVSTREESRTLAAFGLVLLLCAIWYSILCGIGYKHMRFANAPRAVQPQPPSGHTIEAPRAGGGGSGDGQ